MSLTAEMTNPELLEVMENKLTALISDYRKNRNQEAVRQYQALLRCMIELGFDQPLDIDTELPDSLLPVEYLRLHRPSSLK